MCMFLFLYLLCYTPQHERTEQFGQLRGGRSQPGGRASASRASRCGHDSFGMKEAPPRQSVRHSSARVA